MSERFDIDVSYREPGDEVPPEDPPHPSEYEDDDGYVECERCGEIALSTTAHCAACG